MTQSKKTIKHISNNDKIVIEAVALSHNNLPGISASVLAPNAGATFTEDKFSDTLSSEVVNWGSDNQNPKNWRLKLEKSTTAFPLLWKSCLLLYGLGLRYYKEVRTADGITKDFTPVPEIDDFLSNNDVDYLMIERLMDFKFFNNIWCEFILTADGTKITNINHLEAEFCRFLLVNDPKTKQDYLGQVQVEGDWANPKATTKIPYLSKNKIIAENVKAIKERKFVAHSCFPVPGRTVYAVPPQIALYNADSWLDFSNSIPGIMNSINKNVMDIRYHIQIPYEYWPSIYANWEQLEQAEKNKLIEDKLTQMQAFLSDKNAGNSFISHFATDPITGKKLSGWVIEEIGSTDKKDKFLTSVQESDTQIVRALNLDISLAGIQPAGGKMGAGSGSDKRTGFTNQVSLSAAEMLIVTQPLQIVQRINGWDPSVKWTFEYDVPTTLNQDKSGTTTQIQ